MLPRRPKRAPRAARAVARALILALMLLSARIDDARAHVAEPEVTLYTIGPGSYLFSLYGHSVLCVADDCYDYGLPIHSDPLKLVWHGLRGVPDFAPVRIDRARVLAAFGREERSIEAQALPLDARAVAGLRSRLERDVAVRSASAYAYNPWFGNCTTHLRDIVDDASAGRLRGVVELDPARTFRELSEAGFSGRVLPLLGMTLAVGQGDRVGTPFERMFLPAGLRDGVTKAFGVPPTRVHAQRGNLLETSVHAGRALLVFIGLALTLMVVLARKRPRIARGSEIVAALTLALLGVVVWGFAILTSYPEVSRNWNLAILLPTDALLPLLSSASPARARLYIHVRLAVVVALALLSAVGVIAQPLVVPALTCALPLLAMAAIAARRDGGHGGTTGANVRSPG